MKRDTDIFKSFANQTRLRIFLLLTEKDLCVTELEEILNLEQSRISHNLKELKDQGLLKSRDNGKWKIYSVNKSILKNKIIKGVKEELGVMPKDFKKLKKLKGS